jgi:hypothetical protein
VTGAPQPSTARLALGIVLFFAAIAVLPFGFAHLAAALEGPGYGSAEVRNALIVLGIAGAVLGAGVCLMIWEGAARLRRW